MIPIKIASDGTVTKASTNSKWYNYANKEWANAVVLKDQTITYADGATIPESNIESYFVWIPKYSYQLWDLGDYSALSSIEAKEQEIKIRFGLTNTSDSKTGECASPQVAGETGNCEVGEYMTHPSFLAFDTTGFWVGKFETGYDGATTKAEAQSNTTNVDKVIIKPNVYSWRNVKLGFAFQTSYEYLRSDESHLIKNTEWGAVAYLHHSTYGSQTSVRVNNNSGAITGYAAVEEPTKGYATASTTGNRVQSTSLGADGTYTLNYLNSSSVVASTTGNITGIYDMAGGTQELVAGYTTGASTKGGSSGITGIYSDFLTNTEWEKYYDKYSSTVETNFNNRILGDATGEMGPFKKTTDADSSSRAASSWYGDMARMAYNSYPWVTRGWTWLGGTKSGIYTFMGRDGAANTSIGYRIVLAPENPYSTTEIGKILVNNKEAILSTKENKTYDYYASVSNTTTTANIEVIVASISANASAKVVITDKDGTSALSIGNNLYTIKVTSADGSSTKEYVLNVYRKGPYTTPEYAHLYGDATYTVQNFGKCYITWMDYQSSGSTMSNISKIKLNGVNQEILESSGTGDSRVHARSYSFDVEPGDIITNVKVNNSRAYISIIPSFNEDIDYARKHAGYWYPDTYTTSSSDYTYTAEEDVNVVIYMSKLMASPYGESTITMNGFSNYIKVNDTAVSDTTVDNYYIDTSAFSMAPGVGYKRVSFSIKAGDVLDVNLTSKYYGVQVLGYHMYHTVIYK